MKIDLRNYDISLPFSLLRNVLPELDSLARKKWCDSPLTRVIFHKTANDSYNLSDKQDPNKQLRYYTSARIQRSLNKVAEDYVSSLNDKIDIFINSFPAEPDMDFLKHIDSICNIHITRSNVECLIEDLETKKFNNYLCALRKGVLQSKEIGKYLSLLLNYGDSWTAELFVKEYLKITSSVDSQLLDLLGMPFCLQGDTGMAELLWKRWSSLSPLDDARASYSLAMLYARHHYKSLRDDTRAREYLDHGWDILNSIDDTEQVKYEKVFNRNGIALIYYRNDEEDKAIEVESNGIKILEELGFHGDLHQTVLISNLARVYESDGNFELAEKNFRLAIELDPNFAEFHQDLAAFLIDRGRITEAFEECNTAIRLDPGLVNAYRLAGYILFVQEDYLRARGYYEKAFLLNNHDSAIDSLRASYYAGDYEWIVSHYEIFKSADSSVGDQAEANLIYAWAIAKSDSNCSFHELLVHLKKRFPDDELVNETCRLEGLE